MGLILDSMRPIVFISSCVHMSFEGQTAVGAIIGGSFGAAFILANADTPLGSAVAVLFRVTAVAGLLALCLPLWRTRSGGGSSRHAAEGPGSLFGPRYWTVVAVEALLLVAGLIALRALDSPQPLNVAWIALIVGLHFVAFAVFAAWQHDIMRTGWAIAGLGAAGFILSTFALDWATLVSGVLTGSVLLGGTLAMLWRAAGVRVAGMPN